MKIELAQDNFGRHGFHVESEKTPEDRVIMAWFFKAVNLGFRQHDVVVSDEYPDAELKSFKIFPG